MSSQQDTPHSIDPVHAAYSARAHEYIGLLGHIDSTAPEDRRLVDQWARKCTGRVIDVGCGPGHWTAYLTEAGINATGIDPVPEFVDHAQRTYPNVQFRQGTVDDLSALPSSLAGPGRPTSEIKASTSSQPHPAAPAADLWPSRRQQSPEPLEISSSARELAQSSLQAMGNGPSARSTI